MSHPFQWITDLFAREFDRAGVRAEYQRVAGEVWLTLFIPDPTPASRLGCPRGRVDTGAHGGADTLHRDAA